MSIHPDDTVKFLNNYGNCYWVVLERGKHKAKLRALGCPDGPVISAYVRDLKFCARTHREKT